MQKRGNILFLKCSKKKSWIALRQTNWKKLPEWREKECPGSKEEFQESEPQGQQIQPEQVVGQIQATKIYNQCQQGEQANHAHSLP